MSYLMHMKTVLDSKVKTLFEHEKKFKLLRHKVDRIWFDAAPRILTNDPDTMLDILQCWMPIQPKNTNRVRECADALMKIMYTMLENNQVCVHLRKGVKRPNKIFLNSHEVQRSDVIYRMIVDICSTLHRADKELWYDVNHDKIWFILSTYFMDQHAVQKIINDEWHLSK
uniref:Uncharacterized protein n=1 Tax=Abalone asfa-like virus TaxID=2839893 RepID=A0A5K7Y0X9_9VIRU|nr:hypothetical protein [Abalone asfa-like virus]